MAKKYYLPTSETGRRTLVNTLADNLPGAYATKYAIAAADLTALENFRLWYNWCGDALDYTRSRAQGYTQLRDAVAYGANNAAGNLTPPVAFALSAFPSTGTPPVTITPVANGFKLLASIVTRIKSSTNYEVSDGEAPGTAAVWRYRAIYLMGDEVFGQWSDVVSIAVTG